MDALPKIGKPAAWALHEAGLRTLAQLARRSESEVGALHGVGPKALRLLRELRDGRVGRFVAPGILRGNGLQALAAMLPLTVDDGSSGEIDPRMQEAGPRTAAGLVRSAEHPLPGASAHATALSTAALSKSRLGVPTPPCAGKN